MTAEILPTFVALAREHGAVAVYNGNGAWAATAAVGDQTIGAGPCDCEEAALSEIGRRLAAIAGLAATSAAVVEAVS